MTYVLIFLGSGLGGVLRFLMGPFVQKLFNGWLFPIGTFSVNMLGCLVIGILGCLAETKGMFQGQTRMALFVGLLGGFTTFSSFGFETFQLLRDGQYLYAGCNAVLQVVLGLVCVWLGFLIGRLM
jgi:CrcB protein